MLPFHFSSPGGSLWEFGAWKSSPSSHAENTRTFHTKSKPEKERERERDAERCRERDREGGSERTTFTLTVLSSKAQIACYQFKVLTSAKENPKKHLAEG